MAQRASSPWTYDLLSTYRGASLKHDFYTFSMKQRYSIAAQLLYAVFLMNNARIMHRDLHLGNIVYRRSAHSNTLPLRLGPRRIDDAVLDDQALRVSIVDYGVSSVAVREFDEHEDLDGLVALFASFDAIYSAAEKSTTSLDIESTNANRLVLSAWWRKREHHWQRVLHYIEQIAGRAERDKIYALAEAAAETSLTNEALKAEGIQNITLSILQTTFQVYYPREYAHLMRLPNEIKPWLEVEDFEHLYDNWSDVDRSILYFSLKTMH